MPVFATSVIFGVFAMPAISGIFQWNLPTGQYLSNPGSFTGMDRNGPNYRNGLPEWTLTRVPEYFLCTLLGQSDLK